MKKEIKLVNKVKRLLRQLKVPKRLHRFGPKTYEFADHFTALLIKFFCRLSYRRTKQFLSTLGIKCPSKSSLQRTARKLNSDFWQKALKVTSGASYLVAIDGTGLARTNPSYHYLKRIDGSMPKVPVKLSGAFDTRKKKFCAAKIRVVKAHDIKDLKYLLLQSKPKVLVADKAYDALWVHELCNNLGTRVHIPLRKWKKPRFGNMGLRMKSAQKFRPRVYRRRVIIESGFSAFKRKFGASVSSKTVRTIRTEVYGKLLCHNLFLFVFGLSGQSRWDHLFHIKTILIIIDKMIKKIGIRFFAFSVVDS